jgi:predicted Fe-Mo cluster-binding NifX family protein
MSSGESRDQALIAGIPVVRARGEYYLSPHFGRAPFFAFVEVMGDKYRVLEVLENTHSRHEHGRGRGVVDLMLSRGVKAVVALGIGYGAFYKLKEIGVNVYYFPASEGPISLNKAIEMLISKQLVEALEPREIE